MAEVVRNFTTYLSNSMARENQANWHLRKMERGEGGEDLAYSASVTFPAGRFRFSSVAEFQDGNIVKVTHY
jgi:hypothetical protein